MLAHIQRSARLGATAPGAVMSQRSWGDAASSIAIPASGGHDLSRIHVSAPAADAPIQRVRWRWDASQRQWDPVGGSSSTSVPPAHRGSAHGEEYEDTYTQATDPTAQPYLGSAQYFGEAGARLQTQGREPNADQIREQAVRGIGRGGGAGLHEVVPTNLRGFVARSRNPALVGAQSGLRTSTDYQLFSPTATSTGEVGGHTGFFRNPSGSGSTHTRGQAPAHDTLREAAERVEHEADADVVVNELTLAHLASTPTGQDVLQSGYITGGRPNLSAFGTLGPTGSPLDPDRLALAQDVHERRELVKARERGRARTRDPGRSRLRSPSPQRTPIDASGGGGGYVSGDRTTWATAPVPRFPGSGWESVANETAWLTQPQRHGLDPSSVPLVRPTPSTPAPSSTPVTLSPPVTTSQAAPTPTPSPPQLAPPPGLASSLLAPASATPAVLPLVPPAASTSGRGRGGGGRGGGGRRGGRGGARGGGRKKRQRASAPSGQQRQNPPRKVKKPRTG